MPRHISACYQHRSTKVVRHALQFTINKMVCKIFGAMSKNFENRLTFGEVMGKSLMSCFLAHGVDFGPGVRDASELGIMICSVKTATRQQQN